MFYIVYRTTNLINKKIYIGMHKQENDPYEFDGYYGSGLLLNKAIEKYGKENFIRETLHIFDNEEACRYKEKEIVNEQFCLSSKTYNLSVGGQGGNTTAGYSENEKQTTYMIRGEKISEGIQNRKSGMSENELAKYQKTKKENMLKIRIQPNNKGRKHSDESKKNMANSNHMKNKKYITNGIDNLLIGKNDEIPIGWWNGRTIADEDKFKGHSETILKKLSAKRQGGKWYNNGVNTIYVSNKDTPPDGFVRGMIRKKNTSGARWITNGVKSTKILPGDPMPIGYSYGRAKSKNGQ